MCTFEHQRKTERTLMTHLDKIRPSTNCSRNTHSSLTRFSLFLGALLIVCAMPLLSQSDSATNSVVPRLLNYSGKVSDVRGNPLGGAAGVTFAIYKDEEGGAPLWLETQVVAADATGHYAAKLGATKPAGLPMDLFTTGDARWLGVRLDGGEEQPRVLLLSVPYALKAADAETIGGLPPSAFMLAVAGNGAGAPASSRAVPPTAALMPASTDVTTTGGTVNMLPLFTSATNVQNSTITQSGRNHREDRHQHDDPGCHPRCERGSHRSRNGRAAPARAGKGYRRQ
jgi:hypothetical protein